MKILILAGYAKSLINFRGPLLEAMAQEGNEVIACAPGRDPAIVEQLEKMGITFESIPLDRTAVNPAFDLLALLSLYRLMRKHRPQIVFAYTIKPVIYGSWAARMAKIPRCYSMITGLGSTFTGKSFKERIVYALVCRLYRFGLKGNKLVFFQNPDDQQVFRRLNLLGEKTDTVLVNGSGVDLNHYSLAPEVKNPVIFLLMARLIKEKGIEQYVAAAQQLKQRYGLVRFQLLGHFDSNPSAISREQVASWQKEGSIEYLGGVDDVRPFVAACSVFVLPSYYREGTPRTVLEAMAMGKPVITTDAPGCRETVKPSGNGRIDVDETKSRFKIGPNGILVPVKDIGALAGAMRFFVEQPDEIVRMGRESRRYAEERYDVQKVNAVLLKEMGLGR